MPFARAHRVAVPGDGVDLTVVGDDPEGLRHRPGGFGIRAETLMGDGERRRVVAPSEVGEEGGQVERADQRLVDNGTVAQRDDVEIARSYCRDTGVDGAPDPEETLLEELRRQRQAGRDEDLLDPRQ